MKKALLLFVIMAGVATTTQAQEATKKNSVKQQQTEVATAETVTAELTTDGVREVDIPVFDEFGNEIGVKRARVDREGKILPTAAEVEQEKARRMEMEATKN